MNHDPEKSSGEIVLSVRDLKTYFYLDNTVLKAIDGISFDLRKGQTLCLVGESGCGKSMTALSLLGLVPAPGKVVAGSAIMKGRDILKEKKKNLWQLRGKDIGMIFQEPMTSLNPVLKIGYQISEVYRIHGGLSKDEAREKAIEMLRLVHIPEPEQRYNDYPHQLSGGMRQRVMIAMALACDPEVLICDEPTTALDVTVQAQIMRLIVELQQKMGMSVLLITHDMGVVSEMADEIFVIYAGRVVETSDREGMFLKQYHPYSEALIRSIPVIGDKDKELYSIPGMVVKLTDAVRGCAFCDRCPYAQDRCREEVPELKEVAPGRKVACYRYE